MFDKVKTLIMDHLLVPNLMNMINKEKNLAELDSAVKSSDTSPERFEILLETLKLNDGNFSSLMSDLGLIKTMRSNAKNIGRTFESLSKNPTQPRSKITTQELTDFEEYAKKLGVEAVGYTRLTPNLIFKERAVLFENAIVLLWEMDRDKMEMAPSKQTEKMIMKTYNVLGIATNKLVSYLQQNGYAAQGSHPLGGIVLYPPLAEKAGLGYHGLHGLLITPEYGPRVRLSAIFTSITNLPVHSGKNPHEWISEFCRKCHRCIRKCPSWAILEKPILNKNGLLTHIDNSKCFPVFLEYHSCSLCIKECSFNRVSYYRLKKKFDIRTKPISAEEIDFIVESK